jgi:hypothetical protein
MSAQKLYMILVGCKPIGRHTEQHDVFFGIAENMSAIVPQLKEFWSEAANSLHVDAFRTVTEVDGYSISVTPKSECLKNEMALFFVNLGGYKPNEMDEFHYRMLIVAKDKAEAIQKSKQTAFYKHVQFGKAYSHVDDKYGVDVDDVYAIEEVLSEELKRNYALKIESNTSAKADELHLGYFILKKLEKGDLEAS